jgi:hypothetical protein
MSIAPGSPDPRSAEDLCDPRFVAWVEDRLRGDELEPDDQDYDWAAKPPSTEKGVTEMYRLAQVEKMKRMYAGWKASQN